MEQTEILNPDSFLDNSQVVAAYALSYRSNYERYGKRVLDLTLAIPLTLLFAPIMLIVACLVKATSYGPALYTHERIGFGGKRFRCLKFRTMRIEPQSAEFLSMIDELNKNGILYKSKTDPRLTPVGLFLRVSSLDELPQLLNVIGGSMSLVGPRPLVPQLFNGRQDTLLHRSQVKPGITGPWQIYARAHCNSLDDMLPFDLDYAKRQTFTNDIRFLGLTLPAVLIGRGGV